MVEAVTAYKSSDGAIHATQQAAAEWEATEFIAALVGGNRPIAKSIVDNSVQVAKLLNDLNEGVENG